MAEATIEFDIEPGPGEPGARVVRATVRNGSGWAIPGAQVTFSLTGDATFAPRAHAVTASAVTDERGFAWARWSAMHAAAAQVTVTARCDARDAHLALDHFGRRLDVGPWLPLVA